MAFALTLIYILLTFLSISDTFPDLATYRVELVVAILGLLATLPALLITRTVRAGRQAALMAIFSAWVIVSWLPHGWFGGALMTLQKFMPLGIVFFLAAFNVRTVKHLKILRFSLILISLYLTGRGLFDYFFQPEDSVFVMIQHEFGLTVARLQGLGILSDPNAFAQFLLAVLPLLFFDAASRGWLWRILILAPSGALLLSGIFFTHSRGALVGLALLLGFLIWRRVSFLLGGLIAGAAAILLFAIGFTGGRGVSVDAGMDRLDIWSEGLGMFKSSPILGIGFNGFMSNAGYTAHNSFLLCAVEVGLVGCFLWVGLLLVSMWQLRRIGASISVNDSDPELTAWANGVFLSLVAFLMPAFFLSETWAPMLYLLLGMSAAITRLEVERTGVDPLPEGHRWQLKAAMTCFASMTLVYILVRSRSF